jgi:hypothetical protein
VLKERTIWAVFEAERRARSIRYRLGIPRVKPGQAQLPLATQLDDFDFAASSVNEPLIRELHDGGLPSDPAQSHPDTRQYVSASTGTGKTHLAIAIAANCIGNGARGRFCNSLPPT